MGKDTEKLEKLKRERALSKAGPFIFIAMAEGRGFEPLVGHPTTDFKSAAIDHSASPPQGDIISSRAGLRERQVR